MHIILEKFKKKKTIQTICLLFQSVGEFIVYHNKLLILID